MATFLNVHGIITVLVVSFVTICIGSADIPGIVGNVLSDTGELLGDTLANALNIGSNGECLLCGQNPENCRAVPLFSYCFSKGILSSPELLDVFDFSHLTPKQEEDALYLLSGQAYAEKGDKQPSKDSNVTTRYISSCINSLSLPLMIRLYSVPVAKFLKNKGKLNSDNACDLAEQYVQAMKDAADSVNDVHCDQRAKPVVLELGYENFHTALGLYTSKNIFQMALLFGNDPLELSPALKGSKLLLPKNSGNDDILKLRGKDCKEPSADLDLSFCNFNPPAVKKFVDRYLGAVSVSETLQNGYDIQDLNTKQSSFALFAIPVRCYAKVGIKNPVQLSQGIEKAFNGFNSPPNPTMMAKAYAASIGKLLFAGHKLTLINAIKLADDYIRSSKKMFKSIVDNSNPMSKPTALLTVGRNFLQKNGVFKPDDGPQLASFFGMQWSCIANEVQGGSVVSTQGPMDPEILEAEIDLEVRGTL